MFTSPASFDLCLAAPTTVSPAPAAEQKQHQKNNQYGFHVVPRLYEEAGPPLLWSSHFFSTQNE
jgi:hypothetical protein